MASFEDFEKLDIRVAKVLEAEPVEGANKLYKLKIRMGAEERTLVAGIAEQYALDEVLGKKILVITNLDPRSIKGIESQGMLLAAVSEDGKNIALCTVDGEIEDGAKIT